MIENHQQFWNYWSNEYRVFSETIQPYRDAQHLFAAAAVTALAEDIQRPELSILDVGGGAGNMIRPLLEALSARRGHLAGVSYLLTDAAGEMTAIAGQRLSALRVSFPQVEFSIRHMDTLADDFHDNLGLSRADIVISSWNIEYYPPEKRLEIIRRLVGLARPHGVIAYSSSVGLPGGLGIRDILMPFGQAQVLQALLTGGPRQMRKVIASLRQIAEFGRAVNDSQFPAKPALAELESMAGQVGLGPVLAGYHLFGASGMVVARKDRALPASLPRAPIAAHLAGQPGYENYAETSSFWEYFKALLRNPPDLAG